MTSHQLALCDARMKNGLRCPHPAKWSALTVAGEFVVCGVHARTVSGAEETMAMEPLDG